MCKANEAHRAHVIWGSNNGICLVREQTVDQATVAGLRQASNAYVVRVLIPHALVEATALHGAAMNELCILGPIQLVP